MSQDNPITVDASVSIKQSPNLRKVAHKTTAGLSEVEAIERHTIGEYNGKRDSEESEEEKG